MYIYSTYTLNPADLLLLKVDLPFYGSNLPEYGSFSVLYVLQNSGTPKDHCMFTPVKLFRHCGIMEVNSAKTRCLSVSLESPYEGNYFLRNNMNHNPPNKPPTNRWFIDNDQRFRDLLTKNNLEPTATQGCHSSYFVTLVFQIQEDRCQRTPFHTS